MAGKKKGKAFIGTSGFHYNHWIGRFYPKELKKKDWLEYYLRYFKTLELNASFYHLPVANTFDNWRKAVPPDFVFAVKGSRYITHVKKLIDPAEPLNNLLQNAQWLHEKLGPFLWQLPPGWKFNEERLMGFLDALPAEYRHTMEFRNQTWYNDSVFKALEERNIAFCIYELEYHLSPILATADFVYIRLHGPLTKYSGSYSDDTLQEWADRMTDWMQEGKDVYIYFDNDQNGYAAMNAIRLRQMVEKVKIEIPAL